MALLALKRYVVTPLIEITVAIVRSRESGLRWLLYLMLFVFGLYWFCIEEDHLLYLYLLDTIPDFTGIDYAIFGIYSDLLGMVALLVVMPILGELNHFFK